MQKVARFSDFGRVARFVIMYPLQITDPSYFGPLDGFIVL